MAQAVTLLHDYHASGHDLWPRDQPVRQDAQHGRDRGAPQTTDADASFRRTSGRRAHRDRRDREHGARENLARELRGLGCRLALDDFGAGFATLYYLKHLEFDYLKIDGGFVERLPSTMTDQLVVKAVVEIARGLKTDTIAEFVQDDETLSLLHDFGVGYAQGYHTGPPGPLEAVLPSL